jgi:hypothetical protein
MEGMTLEQEADKYYTLGKYGYFTHVGSVLRMTVLRFGNTAPVVTAGRSRESMTLSTGFRSRGGLFGDRNG